VKFLKYASEINVIHEDTLIRLFLVSLEARQKNWVKNCCSPRSISSLTIFIDEFLKQWAPRTQRYEDILHNLTVALQEEGLLSNPIEDNEDLIKEQEPEEVTHEESHQVHKVEHELLYEPIEEHFNEAHHVEDPIHEEDETSVFSPPFDEDEVIQTSIPPAHEEENVVSCTPFQVFDVGSSYDLESDGFSEEPLDVVEPSFDGEHDDAIENIDDFLCIGRHGWDMSYFHFRWKSYL
jgi:hypothetical protein